MDIIRHYQLPNSIAVKSIIFICSNQKIIFLVDILPTTPGKNYGISTLKRCSLIFFFI